MMGWIIGAPSKRRINGKWSVASTAFPTSSAASVAVKKPLKSMPCSSRTRRLVQRIKLKPTKKKIVGGSTCLTCASHQSKARRRKGMGAAQEGHGRGGSNDGLAHTLFPKDDAGAMVCHSVSPSV